MVQKSSKPDRPPARPRGRPRAYDPEQALGQAMTAFWQAGFAATSLDDLAAATGMNRPSLYGAFGDKHALYLATIERYAAAVRAALAEVAAGAPTLRAALDGLFRTALASYLAGEAGPRGCFLIGTAVAETVRDEAVRRALLAALQEIDRTVEAWIVAARRRGELAAGADPVMLARQVSATLYLLGIRARAGEPRALLEATAAAAVTLICGAPPKPARRRAR